MRQWPAFHPPIHLPSISYFVETGQPLFDPDLLRNPDCDGRLLADALGIDYAPLQYVANAEKRDVREAVDMNAALYAGTLGYYFKGMLNKVVRTATLDQLRDFFVEHVTGRGPLPAIRVGKQPYGVLLTSDFSQWTFPMTTKANPFNRISGKFVPNHPLLPRYLGRFAT